MDDFVYNKQTQIKIFPWQPQIKTTTKVHKLAYIIMHPLRLERNPPSPYVTSPSLISSPLHWQVNVSAHSRSDRINFRLEIVEHGAPVSSAATFVWLCLCVDLFCWHFSCFTSLHLFYNQYTLACHLWLTWKWLLVLLLAFCVITHFKCQYSECYFMFVDVDHYVVISPEARQRTRWGSVNEPPSDFE